MNVNYFVTRHCGTGIHEYRFYRGTERIGSAAVWVLGQWDVTLRCPGGMLRFSHDPQMTVFSGCNRAVEDADSGEEYARVYWDGRGRHRIGPPFGSIQVEYREGVYAFGREERCFAALCCVQKGSLMDQTQRDFRDPEWELRMGMMTQDALPDDLAVLLMSFPLLQLSV